MYGDIYKACKVKFIYGIDIQFSFNISLLHVSLWTKNCYSNSNISILFTLSLSQLFNTKLNITTNCKHWASLKKIKITVFSLTRCKLCLMPIWYCQFSAVQSIATEWNQHASTKTNENAALRGLADPSRFIILINPS